MNVAKDNGVVIIALEDDFTNTKLNDFRELVQFEKDAGNSSFRIDFSGTTVIDSMAIGCLVATYNSLRHNEGSLQLVNVPETIRELLKVMHMDRTLAVT
jgi:anti-anti-sigma factor